MTDKTEAKKSKRVSSTYSANGQGLMSNKKTKEENKKKNSQPAATRRKTATVHKTQKSRINTRHKDTLKKNINSKKKNVKKRSNNKSSSTNPKSRHSKQEKRHLDKHTVHATKTEAEKIRRHLVQYMDANGYVSWSAKKRRYTILGTVSTDGGLVPCPSCGVGQLMVIKSPKSGKRFMGCSNFYGGCDASSPLLQRARLRATKKPCAQCRWPEVIFRYSSKQKWTRQCSNIACPTRKNHTARNDG